jgi:hypothetical protein
MPTVTDAWDSPEAEAARLLSPKDHAAANPRRCRHPRIVAKHPERRGNSEVTGCAQIVVLSAANERGEAVLTVKGPSRPCGMYC